MCLRPCESFKSAKNLGPQIVNPRITHPQITKQIEHANRKPAKCHICGRSANLTNYLSSKVCGFPICGIYLGMGQVSNPGTVQSSSLHAFSSFLNSHACLYFTSLKEVQVML
jgi:hypothetical protein